MGDPSLSEVHTALHEALDAALVEVLVALVERDARVARAALGRFHSGVTAHVREEESRVLPLLEGLGLAGARNPQHIVSEHQLLERTGVELEGALAALADEPGAIDVIAVLPLVYRLRGIYEHHSERERLLYPLLDTHAEARALADALKKAASRPAP